MTVGWRPVLTALCLLLGACGDPVRIGLAQARSAVHDGSFRRLPDTVAVADKSPGTVAPTASGQILRLPQVPQPSTPEDVVGLALQPAGPADRQPITFGQVLLPGQLPRGRTVVARADGRELPTQLDVKTTNPDGSTRIGVVTVLAAAPARLMLVSQPAADAPPADPLPPAAGNVAVELVIHDQGGDTHHHFDLGALLAEDLQSGKGNHWLRGPLVTEVRVERPIASSLRLVADLRAYADGTTQADIQFNNDIAMRRAGGTLVYDVTILQDGQPVLRRQRLRHFQYQTWHHVVSNRAPAKPNVVRDVAAMIRAGAVHGYDLSSGVPAALLRDQLHAMAGEGFDILGHAGLIKYMGTTGGRPEIGPLTQANTIWLMTQHHDAARYALAQADAAGSIPWHIYDTEAGAYATLTRYPKLWVDYRGGQWDTKGLTQQPNPASGWTWDTAHQPDLSYVPYLLTGSRYRLDQLQAQASGSLLALWPASRQDDQGIVVSSNEQVRGQAWALRNIVEAAYASPDHSPLKTYFEAVLARNIQYLLHQTRSLRQGEAYGWFPGQAGNGGMTAPWQQDYLASSTTLAALQGVAGAKEVVQWQAHFLARRFLSEADGLPPYDGIAYYLITSPPGSSQILQSWREIARATAAGGMSSGGRTWAKGAEDYGQSAIGALAEVITVTDSADARRAYDWLRARFPHGSADAMRNNPTWNMVPRQRDTPVATP